MELPPYPGKKKPNRKRNYKGTHFSSILGSAFFVLPLSLSMLMLPESEMHRILFYFFSREAIDPVSRHFLFCGLKRTEYILP